MSQFYHLNIDQSLLLEQLSEVGGIVGLLAAGQTVTIGPDDKTALEAFEGVENLLSEIAAQLDAPVRPSLANLYGMDRAELSDYYEQMTGNSLDDVFGYTLWPIIDGQAYVADYLGSLHD